MKSLLDCRHLNTFKITVELDLAHSLKKHLVERSRSLPRSRPRLLFINHLSVKGTQVLTNLSPYLVSFFELV